MGGVGFLGVRGEWRGEEDVEEGVGVVGWGYSLVFCYYRCLGDVEGLLCKVSWS